jgi:hypothetical protein
MSKPELTLIRGGRYHEPKQPKTLGDCIPVELMPPTPPKVPKPPTVQRGAVAEYEPRSMDRKR